VRSGIELAGHVADLVAADDRFELVSEPALSLVVFRLRAGDEATMAAMEAVNASGEAYLSHTTVNGRAAIRLAVGSWRTTKADVDRTWGALREAAGEG
jgi:aromatic-L-amino-acid decarboxylase